MLNENDYKKNKIKLDDPNIVEIFKKHVSDGWSASSFAGKISHNTSGITFLKNSNPEFKKAYEEASKGKQYYKFGFLSKG